METAVIHFIVLGVVSRLTTGAGVLPDGPLNAAVGQTVTFTPTLTPPGKPLVTVIWNFDQNKNIITFNGVTLIAPEYEGRITFSPSAGSLELWNVNLNDTGEYSVFIIRQGEQAKNGATTLRVYEPVSNVMLAASSTDLVEFNSSVTLTCSSSGSSLSFLWLNSSSEVTESDGVQLTDGGSTLTIVNVTRYDQGPFRCLVSNPVSNGSSNEVNLSISYGPENIILTSPHEHYAVGSNITLSCSADSRPAAMFYWFLNGDQLTDTGAELRLTNIQMSRSGNYSCQGFNQKTLRYETSLLSVVSVLERISGVSLTSTTNLPIEGKSVNLTCEAAGTVFNRRWKKDGSDLILADNMMLYDENRGLFIDPLQRTDSGTYSCNVSNPVSAEEATFTMHVNYGPDNVQITGPSEVHVGQAINLTCSAESNPSANYTWMLNGMEIHNSAVFTKNTTEFSDSGKYTCEVTNKITGRTSSVVHILSVTEPVSNVMLAASSTDLVEFNSSVTLTCSSSGSSLSFLWLNSSSEVTESDRVQLTDGGSTLTIVNVTRYDQGPFRCLVSNPVSDDSSSNEVNLSISYGPENIILTSPPHEYYAVGSNFILSCSADSRPAAMFYWFLNGDQLTDTGAELRLTNIQMSQSGNYSCQAFNQKTGRYEMSQSSPVTVLESVSNVMLAASSTDLVEFNSSVTLTCSSSGSSLSFLWLNSSSEVTESDGVQLTDGGSNLTIVSVTRYDQGPFRCLVSNPVSNDSSSNEVNLSISYGPENIILTSPPLEHYAVGSNIILSCSADSRPAAMFYWFLNGDQLTDAGAELRLTNIQMSQSGNYSCQAFNQKTLRYETSLLSVVSVLERISGVSLTSTTNLPIEKKSVNLTCEAAGTVFNRRWKKDGSDLILADNMMLYDENRGLFIDPLQRTDSGTYSCNVSNPVSAEEATFTMDVNYGPDNVQITGPSEVHVGQAINLTCSAESNPSASYTWMLNGTEIHNSAVFTKNTTEFSDSGEYTCQVTNKITERTSSVLHILSVTEPVSNVMLAASSTDLVEFNSSVTLTCSSSGSSLSFLWMNSSSEVTESDRVQLTDGGSTLTIVNVTRYDQGPFRCRVSNPVSDGSSNEVNLSISYGPENITLTSPPHEHYAVGSNIILSCSADSRPAAMFYWFLNGDQLTDTGAELRLTNIQMSQSGNYSCQGFNQKTLRYETSLLSVVSVMERISGVSLTSTTNLPIEGKSVNLTCEAAGTVFNRRWKKDGSDLILTDNMMLYDENRGLFIDPLQRTDSGTYSCNVSNPISAEEATFTMDVNYGPDNVQITGPSEVHVGQAINLTCSAESNPSASYTWILNGTEIHNSAVFTKNTPEPSDSGAYTCQVTNKITERTSSAVHVLSVTEPVSNVTLAASSTDLVEFSSSVTLTCSSSGSSLSFLWLNSSSEVTESDRVQLTDGGSTLTIVNVTRYDQGPFRCLVSNPVSDGSSNEVNLSISYGPENIILASPPHEHYAVGSNITLSCSADSRPAAMFYWFLNGDQLIDTGAELRLTNIQMSQSGNYSCQGFNQKTLRYETSQSSPVTVLEPVSNVMLAASSTDLVEFNSSVTLTCSSSGSSLSFLWLNSSSEVTESDGVQLTDGGSNLTIVNVTRYDQGPFRCLVSNPVSNDSSNEVNLSISYGPDNVILTSPHEHYAVGSNITLSCSADSRPAAMFYWFLNGGQLTDTGAELRLTNIQMSQSGDYSCQAFNNKTLRYETSLLSVVSVLRRISGVSLTSTTNLLIEGKSVNLTCEAAGTVFNRRWKKDGSDLILTDNMMLYDENRGLFIDPLQRTDSGTYSCKVSNPVSAEEAAFTMDVNYGPDNVQITGPSEVHVGQAINLTCSAESNPSANYTWMLNGTEIHNSAVFTKNTTEFSDSGEYTCEVTNKITERTSSAVHILSVTVTTSGCSGGCIAGIVIGCLLVFGAAGGGGYYVYKKKINKKQPPQSNKAEENVYEEISPVRENV
uniref:hemicentin-1-like isoform X4 n=1 Tax=Scatophagus argus TaxID=75038 RepID=UPI001ED7D670|nr:hemicentin-1-like isoform X4 [Scatophagus argus]